MAFHKNIIVGVEAPDSRPWQVDEISEPTSFAVRNAFDLAEATGGTVTMICVLPEVTTGLFGSGQSAEETKQNDRAEAEAFMAAIEKQQNERLTRPVTVSSQVTFGTPWFEILRAAGADRDQLIVCGTRDRSAVSRLLFGSTGLKLLRNAACPVWLVKPREDDDADLDVLAATDLSETGSEILDTAVSLGQNLPVRLTVLHAVDNDLDRHMARTGVSEEDLCQFREKQKEEAEARLNDQLSMTDYRTVEKGVRVQIAEGPADSCILSAIEELDIDLLIMATAGRGGIPGMLFGNTAERLLPEVPCSILAIKPDDFVCPISLT